MSVKYINEESSRLPIPGMGRQTWEFPAKKASGDDLKKKKENPKKGDSERVREDQQPPKKRQVAF